MDRENKNKQFLDYLLTPADGVTDAKLLRARASFWEYCKLMGPKFFKDDRPHLIELANTLQAFYENKLLRPDGTPYENMTISIPPRHGKSYILGMFAQWVFGKDTENRVITVSYNETLATTFAKQVRDAIDQDKADPRITIYNDIFPRTKIKYGSAAAQLWALEGQFFNYLATGFGGTITGIGCNILIIDDPIKNHIEAANDNVLSAQWSWYTDTILSRVEEGGKKIVNMTRWAEDDLIGRLLTEDKEKEVPEWYVLSMPACLNEETKEMLCPALMSYKRYKMLKEKTSPEIFAGNYQQNPYSITGRMYPQFATYTELPVAKGRQYEKVIAYIDTADTGADYLACLVAGVLEGQAYMLDVYYTDAPMEITEPRTADTLARNNVNLAYIESNNGGRGFARNVEKELWYRHHRRNIAIVAFTQSQNKEARIVTHSASVMRNVLMPEDWQKRWPEYYRAMVSHKRTGRNAHDDAADATTGLIEMVETGISTRTSRKSGKGARA